MSANESLGLPKGFELGVATASYQIEGAIAADGRGPSIWDTFSHTPGKVAGGDNGDVACDHYHRYPEDVQLMADLGVDSYRLSVAWPRIQPTGKGPANEEGLAFYDRLVDALLDKGIAPAITLYHWDLPQPLEDAGGWRVRDTAERFAEYSEIVHAHLSDRVTRWITLNEPYCSSILGYGNGRHAPGAQEGDGALAAAHHLLLGHGLAIERLRASGSGSPDQQLGITLNLQPVASVTDSADDRAAADRSLLAANRLFTDPVLAGTYPELARTVYSGLTDFSWIQDGDLETISAPLDFLGVNYYFPSNVVAADYDEPDPARRTAADLAFKEVIADGEERTEMGWPVDSDGLRRLLRWLHDTYPTLPPVYITENGRACDDVVASNGHVHDPDRVRYLEDHLRAVVAATHEGVDVRGYYCWSLLDNFEWAEGYARRFGLVYVDYETQQRIPKSSFEWYRRLIARQHAG
ncbi:GH1 family beta-glucosidase [Luteipulveratus mongoliensis]|uniref:Beta-glucosidase n=1 Tax=Luteipulveratus mongoliensis TaxID=571913 RepID=A0A0K1JLL6_9MICO|nr:GH1 family beta-glucosidase [Luteipulveratus mongoliensis]AKU17470.1 beta-glucosidase [Luteipulveratus mongoliensis]